MTDKPDITDFSFSATKRWHHLRDMLWYQSEQAYQKGDLHLAASFAQAAALHTIADASLDIHSAIGDLYEIVKALGRLQPKSEDGGY